MPGIPTSAAFVAASVAGLIYTAPVLGDSLEQVSHNRNHETSGLGGKVQEATDFTIAQGAAAKAVAHVVTLHSEEVDSNDKDILKADGKMLGFLALVGIGGAGIRGLGGSYVVGKLRGKS